tara:strand:- start:2241 stop:2681 length:441 start_codon:yes stop_codon:yes gene_type:complete
MIRGKRRMRKKLKKMSSEAKLKRTITRQCSVKRKYATTYKDIKKYFREFNRVVFKNKLSAFGDVLIKDLTREKCMGQVVTMEWKRKGTRFYKLEMESWYKDKRDFLDTLIHEMVHLYQMQNLGDTGAHNGLFWSFEPKVQKIGLRL